MKSVIKCCGAESWCVVCHALRLWIWLAGDVCVWVLLLLLLLVFSSLFIYLSQSTSAHSHTTRRSNNVNNMFNWKHLSDRERDWVLVSGLMRVWVWTGGPSRKPCMIVFYCVRVRWLAVFVCHSFNLFVAVTDRSFNHFRFGIYLLVKISHGKWIDIRYWW